MVALDEKPRHKNTTTRSSKCRGTQSAESGKSVDVCILQRPRITDQKCGSSDDLFITHYSLVIERCASQGMTLDSVTGLYYARNRNYSPALGRWINQDPAGYINGANTYQFAMGNPVNAVDPSGLLAWYYWAGAGAVNLLLLGPEDPLSDFASCGIIGAGEIAGGTAADLTAEQIAQQTASQELAQKAAQTAARMALRTAMAAKNEPAPKTKPGARGGSCSASGSPKGPNKGNLKKVDPSQANKVAEKLGYRNAEDLKGQNGFNPPSRFNIYVDPDSGDVYVLGTGGTGEPQQVGTLPR